VRVGLLPVFKALEQPIKRAIAMPELRCGKERASRWWDAVAVHDSGRVSGTMNPDMSSPTDATTPIELDVHD
jgi:hypothetical protein